MCLGYGVSVGSQGQDHDASIVAPLAKDKGQYVVRFLTHFVAAFVFMGLAFAGGDLIRPRDLTHSFYLDFRCVNTVQADDAPLGD